jgi:hypothetical protein
VDTSTPLWRVFAALSSGFPAHLLESGTAAGSDSRDEQAKDRVCLGFVRVFCPDSVLGISSGGHGPKTKVLS